MMPNVEYKPLSVKPDNGPSLDIEAAVQITTVNSRKGSAQQWAELTLYKTKGGQYVCVSIGRTIIENQRQKTDAILADNITEVIAFFGYRWLAKLLYERAGINATIKVA